MKKAVIVGAGQTGRGFIAPILIENKYELTFIDKDESLIKQLNKEGKYTIRYFGNVKEDIVVDNFLAFCNESEEAEESLRVADVIFTSVFASHLKELIYILKKVSTRRKTAMQIVCCENGVNVKKVLVDAGINAVITEGIIFCTTLRPNESLDLISEETEELPIDSSPKGLNIKIDHMPLEEKFEDLVQRKIYTYNFMSAVIAYLGWYKHYESYSDAANDKDIVNILRNIKPVISEIIAKKYNIAYEEQLRFTQCAIDKFQNKEILDTIYRNARQAKRKLGLNERILSPLTFSIEQNENIPYMNLIIAAAMLYAKREEKEDITSIYEDLNWVLKKKRDIDKIKQIYNEMELNIELSQIIEG